MKKNTKKIVLFAASFLTLVSLASCGTTYSDKEFTYNTYLSTKPGTWNVHDWETSDESYINSFTEMGLYDVILDESKSNYEFACEMASEFPIKVTIGEENGSKHDITGEQYDQISADYYGGLGLSEGMIWDIPLNQLACWENGTPIKAVDYVESMKRQLSPELVNFRADSYYSSNLVIANAEAYYKSGRQTVEPLYNYVDHSTFDYLPEYKDETSTVGSNYYINFAGSAPIASDKFADGADVTLFTLLDYEYGEMYSKGMEAGRRIIESGQYYCMHFAPDSLRKNGDTIKDWEKVQTPNDVKEEMMKYDIPVIDYDKNQIKVRKTSDGSWSNPDDLLTYKRADLIEDIKVFVSSIFNKNHANSERGILCGNIKNKTFEGGFGKVGIAQVDEYTIRLYLSKAIKLLDLKFSLTGNWLVKTDLYDKLITKTGKLSNCEYASKSVNNYMSYGPYKLTKYEDGHSFFIGRNEKWYGYTDGKHENQFQMTGINTRILEDHQTARGEFEKGMLDDFTLDANDMKDYGYSNRLQQVFESYTQKISFNSSRQKLKARQEAEGADVNKEILANLNFRKGLSLALNRNDFAASTTAGSQAFTGLLNSLYLTDVEIGEMYTKTDQAKGIYNDVYGTLGGDPYAEDYTVTALESKQNGYNFQQATYYVEQGITEEINSGSLAANDRIVIEFQVYDDSSETTKSMRTFIENAFKRVVNAAVSKYNEKNPTAKIGVTLELDLQKNEDYYNSAKSGDYDMIFSIWGGAAINPYGLMQVYCDPEFESTCEYGFKGKQDDYSFEIDFNDGKGPVTNTFFGWYKEITNNIIEEDIEDLDRANPNFKDQILPNLSEEDLERLNRYNETHSKRVTILAKLEAAILNRFEAIPLVARASSSIYSIKVEYGTDHYINLVGYGGVRFMTFTYNDKAWNEFITSSSYDHNALYK